MGLEIVGKAFKWAFMPAKYTTKAIWELLKAASGNN